MMNGSDGSFWRVAELESMRKELDAARAENTKLLKHISELKSSKQVRDSNKQHLVCITV